jgi:hypothetical protein
MRAIATAVLGSVAVLVAGAGFAASSYADDLAKDQAYCSQLVKIYTEGGMGRGGTGPQSLDLSVAIAQCREGDPAVAIPVLQQRLRDAGFEVPPRS